MVGHGSAARVAARRHDRLVRLRPALVVGREFMNMVGPPLQGLVETARDASSRFVFRLDPAEAAPTSIADHFH